LEATLTEKVKVKEFERAKVKVKEFERAKVKVKEFERAKVKERNLACKVQAVDFLAWFANKSPPQLKQKVMKCL
jgi:hypothetical protein